MNKIEYSRIQMKRTSQTGVVPTINSGDTIDNTWLTTDILPAELFLNSADNKLYTRTDAGIYELIMNASGSTLDDLYLPLTGGTFDPSATLASDTSTASGPTSLAWGTNNTASATNTVIGGGFSNQATEDNSAVIAGYLNQVSGYNSAVIGGYENNISGADSTVLGGSYSVVIADESQVLGGQYNTISGKRNSIISSYTCTINGGNNNCIIGGTNNEVALGVIGSAIIGGNNITADTNNTLYVPNIALDTEGVITSLNGTGQLSLDNDGTANKATLSSNSGTSVTLLDDEAYILATETGGKVYIIPEDSIELGLSLSPTDTNVNGNVNIMADKGVKFGTGNVMVMKELEIGDWDMNTTISKSVNHGLSATEYKTIRQMSVEIRDDGNTVVSHNLYNGTEGHINATTSTQINLTRNGGGIYDSTSFDSTSYNRGFITFWYTPD